MGHVPICRMMPEEFLLGLESLRQRLVRLDVLLRSIDHADESQLQRIHSTRQDIERVGPVIHEVDFSEHPDRPSTHRIDISSQLQSFGIDDIHIGRRDGQDDTVGLGDILRDERPGLLLDIRRLISNRYLRRSGEMSFLSSTDPTMAPLTSSNNSPLPWSSPVDLPTLGSGHVASRSSG